MAFNNNSPDVKGQRGGKRDSEEFKNKIESSKDPKAVLENNKSYLPYPSERKLHEISLNKQRAFHDWRCIMYSFIEW